MSKHRFHVGDFVWFYYTDTDRYPAQVKSIKGNKVSVEVSLNRRIKQETETDILSGTVDQLETMF